MTDVRDNTSSIITDNVSENMDSVKSLFSEQKENAGFNIYTKIAIGFFILALLGINLFGYASVLTETISDTIGKPFRHLGSYLGFYTGETIKKTAELSAEGTKFTADIAKDAVVNTVDAVTEQTKNIDSAVKNIDTEVVKKESEHEEIPYVDRNDLMKSFDTAIENKPKLDSHEVDFISDDAGSSIQKGNVANNQGWCYVGEDRGFRSCVEVGRGHECMSGDIFPSKDVCINPNLR